MPDFLVININSLDSDRVTLCGMPKESTAQELQVYLQICSQAISSGSQSDILAALDTIIGFHDSENEIKLVDLAQFAGLLIDGGLAIGSLSLIEQGRLIFENYRQDFLPLFGATQLNYNIANAFKGQFDLERQASSWDFTPSTMESLYQATQYYWQALKEMDEASEEMRPRLLTNLAISLSTSARVVDALGYYDTLLKIHPDYGMGLINKAHSLEYLKRISGSVTIKLLYEIYSISTQGASSDDVEHNVRVSVANFSKNIATYIRELGYDPQSDPDNVQKTALEFSDHDDYWRWCLHNALALSEHSLYCFCAGARRDDLSVLTATSPLSGEKVPDMELRLNRIKSEFFLARALLFQATIKGSNFCWNTEAFEGTFTDLHENEEIGIGPEFLRTSFRLCFGVLDKIAVGVCALLDLQTAKENIYFHSFWRSNKRWETLGKISNPGLIALYGLARDLSQHSNGEWSHLRKYRNLLEHDYMFVQKDKEDISPPTWLDNGIATFGASDLESDAIDMMRFTRAAIFYFTFFVRIECESVDVDHGNGLVMQFEKKPIGKN